VSNKRRVIMATLMLAIIMGQAGALTLIDYLMPVVLGPIGIIGYYFGTQTVDQTYVQELEQEYQQLLTSSKQTNDRNIQQMLLEVYARDQNLYGLGADFGEYTKNYAWALAKFRALEALKAGKTLTEAKTAAKLAVMDYYYNVTQSLVNNFDATNTLLNRTLNEYKNYAGVSEIRAVSDRFNWDDYGSLDWFELIFDPTNQEWSGIPHESNPYIGNDGVIEVEIYLNPQNMLIAGKSWSINTLWGYIKWKDYKGGGRVKYYSMDYRIKTVEYAGVKVYNTTLFYSAIQQIDTAYNQIINEIDLYVDNLAASVNLTAINISDYYDPYIMASQFNTDLNASGYAGYAAAELALLGFNTTGINKTITIQIGNKTFSGWLFTTWGGMLQTNSTYTADIGKWYILTDNGLYEIPQGATFKVVALKDISGNPMTNTTLKSYTSATADTAKIYDELAALRQLWEEYLQLQPIAGGGASTGSGFNFSEWWNNLGTMGQLGVIAIGAVGAYALLRRD